MALRLRFLCPLRELPRRDGQLYCASCDHTVVDLASMSPDEATAWLAQAPAGACVRVRRMPRTVVAAAGALAVLSAAGHADEPQRCVEDPEDHAAVDFGGIGDEPYLPTAQLWAHADGWEDGSAVVAQVMGHPGPFRRALEPLASDAELATLVLRVRADGTVAEVHTKPASRRAHEALLRLRFPPPIADAEVVVHYGPGHPHLYMDPRTGEKCREP